MDYLENYLKKVDLKKYEPVFIRIYKKFSDRFYLEIQRHNDQNEIAFEKFNLKQSLQNYKFQ